MIVHAHDYDSAYDPAMPVIEVQISRRAGAAPTVLTAIVDSGADGTMIPLPSLRQIQARKTRTRWLVGLGGLRYEVDSYVIALRVGDQKPLHVEVVALEGQAEAIIGRDVLNQYVVTLNALAHVVEVAL